MTDEIKIIPRDYYVPLTKTEKLCGAICLICLISCCALGAYAIGWVAIHLWRAF